jgi:hypothetical protein
VNRSASFVLGALCVGALGIAGPTTASYLAREFITLHPGDTIAPHYAVLTDTVLTVAPGKIIAKHCGTSKAFLRFWKLRPATHDSVITNGDSVTVSVTGTTAQPCIAEQPVPTPTDTTFTVFGASDFESGTLAPFINPYAGVLPGALDVVNDPTNSGHGKVLRIHYWNAPLQGWFDNNDAIEPDPSDPKTHAGLGSDVIFQGDFYIPRGAMDTIINRHGLRKLVYWGASGNAAHYVLTMQPTPSGGDQQLMSSITQVGPSNLPCDCPYYGASTVSENAWHTLKIEIRFNSTLAKKDGVLRIWLDGAVVTDRSAVQWDYPLWTGGLVWYDWRVGEQTNTTLAFDEYR